MTDWAGNDIIVGDTVVMTAKILEIKPNGKLKVQTITSTGTPIVLEVDNKNSTRINTQR